MATTTLFFSAPPPDAGPEVLPAPGAAPQPANASIAKTKAMQRNFFIGSKLTFTSLFNSFLLPGNKKLPRRACPHAFGGAACLRGIILHADSIVGTVVLKSIRTFVMRFYFLF
ncbi:hypothetical protein, partial [Allofournierella sp.]|uniref:hypothetical protein n=1 Tax=Allofournierella sp. TaxID=1940256 RepID=UPI003AB78701